MATRKPKTQPRPQTRQAAAADKPTPRPHLIEAVNGAPHPPDEEQVRRRAYELFLQSGGSHGNDWNDWFRAQDELSRLPAHA